MTAIRAVGAAFLMLLAAACATRPLVSVAPEPAGHAWWLRATFDPHGTAVDGIPARAVHPGWCAVDALEPAHFDAHERADGRDPVAAAGARYSLEGPRVDGQATRVRLVAFRECTGRTGIAMLLLDAQPGARRVLASQVVAMPAAYAMLDSDAPGRLRVVHCRECDAIDEYRWDPDARRWIALDPPEDAP